MFFGQRDRAEWGDGQVYDPTTDQLMGPGSLTYVDVDGLPSSLQSLRERIFATISATESAVAPGQVFYAVRGYLRETVPRSEKARNFMALLAATKGISVRNQASDPLGRVGTAFEIVTGDARVRERIILDPTTGELMFEDRTLLSPIPSIDHDPPVVIGYTTYITWGHVSGVDATVDESAAGIRCA
ncbi:MAG: hypothetical protein H0W81_01905 [Chloroflexi bacterium]|nr:hypothetical protein [Chloroflexota bacterium]